ncbi:MAG: ABC transporter permease [Coriobacteriia bacterium]|nr:ABC transporter permease [Coriobacteriia bacterium]
MLSLRIAWRFLRSSPVQSALIIGGIAVGIAVQVFVGSLITSLQASLVDQTIGSAPQITIKALDEGDPVVYSDRVEEVIAAQPEIDPKTVVPVRVASSLFTDGSDSAPLNLIGGTLAELEGIYKITERTTNGEASLRSTEIMVGEEFAEKFGVEPGDTITLAIQGGSRASFTVSGIFDLGAAAFNERQAFVNGSVPQSVLGWSSSEYSSVQMQLYEPFASAEVAAEMRTKLSGVTVSEWQAENADLLVALQSQGSSSYIIQTFVLVAIALGIASTLAIAAVQKTRQIGILKAMGLSDTRAGQIFLWQAILMGGTGSAAGVALAYFLLFGFSFSGASFTITPQPAFVLGSAAIGMGVALASSIIPTRRTSKLDPIEVIQGG